MSQAAMAKITAIGSRVRSAAKNVSAQSLQPGAQAATARVAQRLARQGVPVRGGVVMRGERVRVTLQVPRGAAPQVRAALRESIQREGPRMRQAVRSDVRKGLQR